MRRLCCAILSRAENQHLKTLALRLTESGMHLSEMFCQRNVCFVKRRKRRLYQMSKHRFLNFFIFYTEERLRPDFSWLVRKKERGGGE